MTALLFLLELERVCMAMDTCGLSIEDDGDLLPGPSC